MNRILFLIVCILIPIGAKSQIEYTTCLYDSARQRPIPVAIYQPANTSKQTKVIIFNHGYGANDASSYKIYSCLTKPLSEKGYYVISIQHELPDDSLLAMEGEFMKTRMPHWERGVENMLFTLHEFKKLKPELDWDNLTIMGHSNGGDMTMLFATRYPKLVKKAISLDHRRMLMPRMKNPQIYTLRGCDYEADPNVIPTQEEQMQNHITVIALDDIKHGDMDNKGRREQHETMLGYINRFLEEE